MPWLPHSGARGIPIWEEIHCSQLDEVNPGGSPMCPRARPLQWRLAVEAAAAVQALHGRPQPVMHRDLKGCPLSQGPGPHQRRHWLVEWPIVSFARVRGWEGK